MMENKFEKYFIKKDTEWHSYKIGEYHVSAVGCSHQDLEPEEHYGPCLRSTALDYTDPIEKTIETKGNLKMGNMLHKKSQSVYKHNNPNSVIEFPLKFKHKRGDIEIETRGSVDIIDFEEKSIPDLKSSSMFTHPSSPYEFNPTHVSQERIYTHQLTELVFRPTFFMPEILRTTYLKKHNMTASELDEIYSKDKCEADFEDFLDRCFYLDKCLRKGILPEAEPHKWCKLCPRLGFCMEKGDIIEVKEGRKKRYLKNG